MSPTTRWAAHLGWTSATCWHSRSGHLRGLIDMSANKHSDCSFIPVGRTRTLAFSSFTFTIVWLYRISCRLRPLDSNSRCWWRCTFVVSPPPTFAPTSVVAVTEATSPDPGILANVLVGDMPFWRGRPHPIGGCARDSSFSGVVALVIVESAVR